MIIFLAPDESGLIAGYKAMRIANGVLEADPSTSSVTAYPLTKIDYAMLRTSVYSMNGNTKTGDPAKAEALKSFLTYAVGVGQTNSTTGYMQLPSELVAQTQGVISVIKPLAGVPTTSTTTSATTTSIAETTTFDTTVTDATFPLDSSCCTGSSPNIDTTTSTQAVTGVTTKGSSGQGPRDTTRRLKVSYVAPNWLPTSGVGASTLRFALPGLFLAGLVALLVRLAWLVAPSFRKFRAAALVAAR